MVSFQRETEEQSKKPKSKGRGKQKYGMNHRRKENEESGKEQVFPCLSFYCMEISYIVMGFKFSS